MSERVEINVDRLCEVSLATQNGCRCALGFYLEQNKGWVPQFDVYTALTFIDLEDHIYESLPKNFIDIASASDDNRKTDVKQLFKDVGVECVYVNSEGEEVAV